jgi:hypothetical protein
VKLMKLTRAAEGKRILVNPANMLAAITSDDDKTTILMLVSNGRPNSPTTYSVQEPLSEVERLFEEATR